MRNLSRRNVIASTVTAIAVSLAGCSGDDNQPDTNSINIGPFSGEYEIPEDEYATTGIFNSDRQGEIGYNFTVTSGPEVDVYLLTPEDVDRYENGQSFNYLSHTTDSPPDAAIVDSVTVSANTATQMLIDNTEVGDVSPPTNFDDDVATVQLKASYADS
ncbi:hypothetical protein [Halorubrum halophilum]|uniref:hypothetical protein n=1 Tax=Halorubrum halophilum TaxID=413816 RepID=UPI0012ABB460|nr:hypothetical protein [Halorubrum halophilum]